MHECLLMDQQRNASMQVYKYNQVVVIQYPWSFTTTMLTGFADPQNVISVNSVWTRLQTSDHAPRCGTHFASNFQEEIGPQWVPVRIMKRLNVKVAPQNWKVVDNCAWRRMPPQCHHRSRYPSWLQHVQHFLDQIGLSSPTLHKGHAKWIDFVTHDSHNSDLKTWCSFHSRGTYFWERAQVSLCISATRRRKASLLSSRPLQRPGRLPETLRFATRHSGHSCRLSRLKIHSNSFNRLHPFNPFQRFPMHPSSSTIRDVTWGLNVVNSIEGLLQQKALYSVCLCIYVRYFSKNQNPGDLLIWTKSACCERVGPRQTHQAPVSWNRLVDNPYQHDSFKWHKDLSKSCYRCCTPGLLLGNYVLGHLTTAFALCKLFGSPHLQGRAPRESSRKSKKGWLVAFLVRTATRWVSSVKTW